MARKWLAIAILVAGGAVAFAVHHYRDSTGMRFIRLAPGRDSRCALGVTWRAIAANTTLWERINDINDEANIVQSDPAGFELIETSAGRFWVPRGNRMGLAEMIGEQEEDVYGAKVGVHSGDVVLDCGANVGVFTRRALEAGARTVVAIEVAPENIECLRRNFATEAAAGRVIVYPKGVWNKDDVLTLSRSSLSGGDSVALKSGSSKAGPQVPLTTIDKLAAELRLERVDFIKMDIEGAERQALEGARDTLRRFRPRMAISMEHKPDDTVVLPATVNRLWPEAVVECGPCTWVHTDYVNHVAPEDLYVR